MKGVSLGDLTKGFILSTKMTELKGQLNVHIDQLGSGILSDISEGLSGDFTQLSSLERGLGVAMSYSRTIDSASAFLQQQYDVLEKIREPLTEIGTSILSAAEVSNPEDRMAYFGAADKFVSICAALNQSTGGRHVFSGAATGMTPVPDPNGALSAFSSYVENMTSSQDVLAAADYWFSDSGPFISDTYKGSFDPVGKFSVADGSLVSASLKVSDESFRETLKLFALISVFSSGAVDLNSEEASIFSRVVGNELISLNMDYTYNSASLGNVLENLDEKKIENSTYIYAVSDARSSLIGVAAEDEISIIQQVQSNLEAVYKITSRLSGMSLVSFL